MSPHCILIALIALCLFGISSQKKSDFASLIKDDEQLVTYNAKFNCGIRMPRWCFELVIFEYDPATDDRIAEHPYICTSRNTSGISLQAYFNDMIEQDNYLEPFAKVRHNCNKKREISVHRIDLPIIYRINNTFLSHTFEVTLDGLGERWMGPNEFADFNNYDDSPYLKKFQLFLNLTNNSTN